jgi:DNA (cytosine-5)-methyltransferase 1
MHKFPYRWNLKETTFTKDKGKVFSCFACGGGSTMGYKLAGFDVIGCNEIDPKMAEAYKTNHNPKYCFVEPIQTFKLRDDLPEELYNLDILDGSPPCSSFSIAGAREEDWGKEKKFREGQAEQVLDTLFFDFIDLAAKLKPKIVVAENVKGLLLGEAKSYVLKILESFDKAGYMVNYWLLDSSDMGVPQKRERVFFLAIRKDIAKPFLESVDMFTIAPKINLQFNEKKIVWGDVIDENDNIETLSKLDGELWEKRQVGDVDLSNISLRERNILSRFNAKFLYKEKVANTITGGEQCVLFDKKRNRNKQELCDCGTYPHDYNFLTNKPEYLIGMSVPPVMTAQIATRIYEQWLSKINTPMRSSPTVQVETGVGLAEV